MRKKNEFRQGEVVSRTFTQLKVKCKIYHDGNIVSDEILLPDKTLVTREVLQKYANSGDVVLDFGVPIRLLSKATCKISDFISLCKEKGIYETSVEE